MTIRTLSAIRDCSDFGSERTSLARSAWGVAVVLLFGLVALLGACTRTPGVRMKDGLAAIEQEHKPEKLVRAGQAYALLGDATRASQYFVMAIESGGDEKAIFPLLLETCIRDKQYRAAIFHAENYLRKHPGDASLRFVAGNLYAAMGDAKQAREHFEEVLRLTPKNPDVHFALAVLCRDGEGDLSRADAHFRAYLELEPNGVHAEEARGSLLKAVP